MEAYSKENGYKCYVKTDRNGKHVYKCNPKTCPDGDTCNFAEWYINGSVDVEKDFNGDAAHHAMTGE